MFEFKELIMVSLLLYVLSFNVILVKFTFEQELNSSKFVLDVQLFKLILLINRVQLSLVYNNRLLKKWLSMKFKSMNLDRLLYVR